MYTDSVRVGATERRQLQTVYRRTCETRKVTGEEREGPHVVFVLVEFRRRKRRGRHTLRERESTELEYVNPDMSVALEGSGVTEFNLSMYVYVFFCVRTNEIKKSMSIVAYYGIIKLITEREGVILHSRYLRT